MFSMANVFVYIANRGRLVPTGNLGRAGTLQTTFRHSSTLIQMTKCIIPELSYSQHKGESGRIGVIGGCQEYTGAPYFAAISALKLGADLSHVFCTKDAATVIKSYSPELIVHPILNESPASVSPWLQRLHAVVVGPGMGRDQDIMNNVEKIVEEIKERKIPCVVDADGLHMLTLKPDIIRGYQKAILTPNVAEFSRLYKKMVGEEPIMEEPVSSVRTLCEKLDNVTIVLKGENDIISDGRHVLVCCGEGSPRRCGGQGDLLSGTMGVFTYWAHKVLEGTKKVNNETLTVYGPTICAAYAACLLTRECNRRAFSKNRRSMTTSDMVECIQESFEFLFE